MAWIRLGNLLLVRVPVDAGDFYLSGTGHLCARTPLRQVVCEDPLLPLGITSAEQIVGRASPDEMQAAGWADSEPPGSGLLLRPHPAPALTPRRKPC